MKKLKNLLIIMAIAMLPMLLDGCAGACQRIKANGSLIGSTKGDWIVVKESGGKITDVYKLEDVMVQSEASSDGWLFLDQNGNPVNIGGDMKAIRVVSNKQEVFDRYVEYHMEFEDISYREKFKLVHNE